MGEERRISEWTRLKLSADSLRIERKGPNDHYFDFGAELQGVEELEATRDAINEILRDGDWGDDS